MGILFNLLQATNADRFNKGQDKFILILFSSLFMLFKSKQIRLTVLLNLLNVNELLSIIMKIDSGEILAFLQI